MHHPLRRVPVVVARHVRGSRLRSLARTHGSAPVVARGELAAPVSHGACGVGGSPRQRGAQRHDHGRPAGDPHR